jgi:hypothetical protein
MVLLAPIAAFGRGLTCTAACKVEVHIPIEPLTTYIVETDGVAMTEAPEAVFRDVDGDQL